MRDMASMMMHHWTTAQNFSDSPKKSIRLSRVDRSNWKAECAETCLLRLERGKGCEALPIATQPLHALQQYRHPRQAESLSSSRSAYSSHRVSAPLAQSRRDTG